VTQLEFETALRAVLGENSAEAKRRLEAVVERTPSRARALSIEIFTAQDGDGFFGVRAAFDGPDLFVLNKPIDDVAELIEPKYTDGGVVPPIPLVEPRTVTFPVNDVVVDTVAAWLKTVWASATLSSHLPVTIVGHDGFGTRTPIAL